MAENERRLSREPGTEEQVPLVGDRAGVGVGGASTCGQDTCLDAQLSSRSKTFFNIFISLMGAGILGLPHSFKESGWIAGLVAIVIVAGLCYYCMILLIAVRKRVRWDITTYGDLAYNIYGKLAQQVTDAMIVVTQAGFCVAYLIFIGENMKTLLPNLPSQRTFMYIVTPFLMMLAWVRSLTALAPFSILADICNIVALAIVFRDDWQTAESPEGARPFCGWSQLAPVFGVAVYCFEGFPMTLPLEASMKNRDEFPWVLGLAMTFVGFLYAVFGMAGYMAYGEATKDIITLNLPACLSTSLVKLGLCVTLFFTFPVMMFPVHGIVESEVVFCRWFQNNIQPSPRLRLVVLNSIRGVLVLAVLAVAAAVPGFGIFIQLVGSSVCSLLGFVMPAAFYMQVAWYDISRFSVFMHSLIIVFGIVFGVWGTWDALSSINGGVPRTDLH